MVAFITILAFIAMLAGAMTGNSFLILVAILLFIVPAISGALLVGLPWYAWAVILLVFIVWLTNKK